MYFLLKRTTPFFREERTKKQKTPSDREELLKKGAFVLEKKGSIVRLSNYPIIEKTIYKKT